MVYDNALERKKWNSGIEDHYYSLLVELLHENDRVHITDPTELCCE